MAYNKPLVEFIAELQKLADANPGIMCTLADHEHGPDSPQASISPVYVDQYGHVIVLDDSIIENTQHTIRTYQTSAQEMWDSYGDDKGLWQNFQEFEAAHTSVKEHAEAAWKDMQTATNVVVISI